MGSKRRCRWEERDPEGESGHIQSLLKEGTIYRNIGKFEGSH